jgi:hypothetical protein
VSRIGFEFTICEVAEAGKCAVKRITPTGVHDYDLVTWWKFEPAYAGSQAKLAEQLMALALQPTKMVVMGAPASGLDLRQAHRRRWADPATATLVGPDRMWMPLDIDGVGVPRGLGRGERLEEAAVYIRDRLLPPAFHGVRLVAAPTASTGRKGDAVARLRLFAALDRHYPLADLKRWTRACAVALDLPLDSAPIQPGQPIYTGRPVADEDPVPRRLHAIVLDDDSGGVVRLDIDQFAARAMAIEERIEAAVRLRGSNWQRLMEDTVGGPEGYFAPLTRSIGVAVRAGASHAEIDALVGYLLTERADPCRQAQYSRAWIQRTMASFQRRDDATRAAHDKNLSRLFTEEARKAWLR